jgi:UDP-N-acetylmuramoylalanine--D-glutamate ligase
MEEYTRAKTNIFDEKTHLVLNADNAATLKIASESGNRVTMFSSTKSGFSEVSCGVENCERAIYLSDGYITVSDGKKEQKLFLASDILIPGKHNVENYMTAIGLTYGMVSQEIYHDVAVSFGGVEHRLELVRVLDGVRYYNSSIDSSPTRTAAALSAVEGGKVVICGGYDKGFDFAPLADVLCKRARCVVLTGATADKIMKAIEEYPNYAQSGLTVVRASDFSGAVDIARGLAVSGESVILSPACASFDAFKNFEERGRVFKALVLALDKKN